MVGVSMQIDIQADSETVVFDTVKFLIQRNLEIFCLLSSSLNNSVAEDQEKVRINTHQLLIRAIVSLSLVCIPTLCNT